MRLGRWSIFLDFWNIFYFCGFYVRCRLHNEFLWDIADFLSFSCMPVFLYLYVCICIWLSIYFSVSLISSSIVWLYFFPFGFFSNCQLLRSYGQFALVIPRILPVPCLFVPFFTLFFLYMNNYFFLEELHFDADFEISNFLLYLGEKQLSLRII